jgi:hypothetical protein
MDILLLVVAYHKYFNHKAKHKPAVSQYIIDNIALLNINKKVFLWFCKKDAYFCVCSIPPEDFSLYGNINLSLFEFDLFEHLNTCICRYSDLGEVYASDNLNSRKGDYDLLYYIQNINLDRSIDLPQTSSNGINKHVRRNHDRSVDN